MGELKAAVSSSNGRQALTDSEITVYGTQWCPDVRRSTWFLKQQGISFRWVDIDQDGGGREFVEQVNNGSRSVPTILFADGSTLVEPSNSELASKLGVEED